MSSSRICPRKAASKFDSGSSKRKTLGRLHDRATHRHALPLPARQLRRPPIEHGRQPEHVRRFADALRNLGFRRLAHLEPEGQVLAHRQMRIERVALKDHGDVAIARLGRGDVDPIHDDGAARQRLEAGDAAQERRLAAARRTDEHEQLAVGDGERDVAQNARRAAILADVYDLQLRHTRPRRALTEARPRRPPAPRCARHAPPPARSARRSRRP